MKSRTEMKNRVKKLTALTLSMAMMAGMAATALAADDTPTVGDILSIDGKSGKIYLNADSEGMNYPLKYLYDVNFWYRQDAANPDPTLGHVVDFLSIGRQEGFSARVDLYKFINSALGEKTAEIWYPHMLYEDQMDEGLVQHWEELGLHKEAYWDDPEVEDGIEGDYFVYTPTKASQPENGYPVVVLFHGGGEVAYQVETFGFCEIAAREGIILIAADSWGSGQTDEEFSAATNAMLEMVKANYPVDASRIYAVGSSGGGNSAMRYAITNLETIAGVAVMDQPVSLATRWYAAPEERIAKMQECTLPMVWVGGTADCYGLHGILSAGKRGGISTEFFETSEGAEEQFISGWNNVMKAFNIEGKDITSRLDFVENPANYAEEMDGYPFDTVENIDPTGTSAIYKCTMDANEDMCLYLVENRPHMPCGYDAENIWSFLSGYRRNLETQMSEKEF